MTGRLPGLVDPSPHPALYDSTLDQVECWPPNSLLWLLLNHTLWLSSHIMVGLFQWRAPCFPLISSQILVSFGDWSWLIFVFSNPNLSLGTLILSFKGGSEVKASACNAGDRGSIPGLGRSPGEGKGKPLQCSCLENPMDGGAWWATVHRVAKSRTRLSDFTSLRFIHWWLPHLHFWPWILFTTANVASP